MAGASNGPSAGMAGMANAAGAAGGAPTASIAGAPVDRARGAVFLRRGRGSDMGGMDGMGGMGGMN